ncbi:hypothetical protein A9W97_18815 [Mycobacterium gordonae]|nr:hypothetical protein A9W97_18815 [Mycobacterium gordonae]
MKDMTGWQRDFYVAECEFGRNWVKSVGQALRIGGEQAVEFDCDASAFGAPEDRMTGTALAFGLIEVFFGDLLQAGMIECCPSVDRMPLSDRSTDKLLENRVHQ